MSRTLSLSSGAFDPKLYTPVKFTGTEAVNELFSYTLIVKTPDRNNLSMTLQEDCSSADLTQWLGKRIHIMQSNLLLKSH